MFIGWPNDMTPCYRMHNSVIAALGGFTAPTRRTRVLFCREIFDYAELEEHPFLCNHLGESYLLSKPTYYLVLQLSPGLRLEPITVRSNSFPHQSRELNPQPWYQRANQHHSVHQPMSKILAEKTARFSLARILELWYNLSYNRNEQSLYWYSSRW